MACAGNPIIHTPHLDRLAAEGVLFRNNFVTTSICAVSRASIFTGLYARCHGIHDFRTPLSESQHAASYPVMLRDAGYRTGFVGKYGVGAALPHSLYDDFRGFSGQGRYFPRRKGKRRHLTSLLGDDAVEFLEDSTDNRPFCLSVSFKAPHVQDGEAPFFLSDPAYDPLYRDVSLPQWKKNDPRYHDQLPAFLRGEYEGRKRWTRRFPDPLRWEESVKRYYRLISGVDAQIGRMLEALDRSGAIHDTIIIFTSDNGFYLGERGLAGKWLMHEESIRTPLIIRDPRFPSRRAARRREMTLNIDLMPTILEMTGLPIPESVNGRSLAPLVRGDTPPWRDEWFYEHLFEHATIPKTEGVRGSRWKYCRFIETDPLYEELYDLEADPQEEHNLAASPEHEARLDSLRGRLAAWKKNLAGWMPDRPWSEPKKPAGAAKQAV